MSKDELTKLLRPIRFRPFRLHLADGRAIEIPHPEFAMMSSDGRSFMVLRAKGEIAKVIDNLQIVSADFEPTPKQT